MSALRVGMPGHAVVIGRRRINLLFQLLDPVLERLDVLLRRRFATIRIAFVYAFLVHHLARGASGLPITSSPPVLSASAQWSLTIGKKPSGDAPGRTSGDMSCRREIHSVFSFWLLGLGRLKTSARRSRSADVWNQTRMGGSLCAERCKKQR